MVNARHNLIQFKTFYSVEKLCSFLTAVSPVCRRLQLATWCHISGKAVNLTFSGRVVVLGSTSIQFHIIEDYSSLPSAQKMRKFLFLLVQWLLKCWPEECKRRIQCQCLTFGWVNWQTCCIWKDQGIKLMKDVVRLIALQFFSERWLTGVSDLMFIVCTRC